MSDQFCCLCNNAIADGVGVCQRCHNRTHRQLDDLITFWNCAHDELLPGRSGNGGRSSERTIGLNVASLSFIAGHDILGLLHSWEIIIRTDRQLTRPAMLKKLSLEGEIKATVGFHQTHLPWSAGQEWFPDFAKELSTLHGLGMAAAKQMTKRANRIPCPCTLGDGSFCSAMITISDRDPLELFSCHRCKTDWTTLSLIQTSMTNAVREVWLDAEAIAAYLGITERHVHRMAAKNGLEKRGQFYDLNALRKVSIG